jgi:hypothetical protein
MEAARPLCNEDKEVQKYGKVRIPQRISPGWVTVGDADFRKAVMKMIYRKLPKTASLPVTCHPASYLQDFCD